MSVSGGFDGWQRVDDGSSLSGSADRGFTNDDMRRAGTIKVFPHFAGGIELAADGWTVHVRFGFYPIDARGLGEDGKIFVLEVANVIRIRTGETGSQAV